MTDLYMIRAFLRAGFITALIFLIGCGLWYHTVITALVLILGWLTLAFYLDPPDTDL